MALESDDLSELGDQWKKGIILRDGDNTLYLGYYRNRGFKELASFISTRYFAIETRMHETFRFVNLEPRNACAFSYEYASLLRDIGSAFDSALKVFGRNVTRIRNPTIYNHLDFLKHNTRSRKRGELADLTRISVELASNRTDRFVYPFSDLGTDHAKPNLPSAVASRVV